MRTSNPHKPVAFVRVIVAAFDLRKQSYHTLHVSQSRAVCSLVETQKAPLSPRREVLSLRKCSTPRVFLSSHRARKGSANVSKKSALMQQLSESSDAAQSSTAWKSLDVIFTSVAYVALSVVNRVAYRMSLQIVPAYTFPLSLFVTMCYVLVYSCILSLRVRSRVVPISQVEWALRNWPLFALIGTLEAATFVIGMFSASRLPGALLPVLNQGILLFIAIASYVLLGRRYTSTQILGLIVVLIGVMLSIGPQTVGHAASDLSSGGIWVNALLFFGSYAFVAIAVVLKERVFKRSGLQPDLFIVNTFSSIMQFLATSITLPFVLTFATQIAGSSSTKAYFSDALRAFAGYDSRLMPWLALGYVGVNIIFNVTGLRLLKIASALDSVVASLISVPLTTLAFCLPLPLLVRSRFSPMVILGLVVLLTGIWLYNLPRTTRPADD
ncbi:hypothetical protein CCYA_CCYA09G2684 [Cyanidiococcus yangmingshanensis]|nr:hypothetical protein CCYA_CCYA09G2684 [Cyanidiococcus yangmingshanensis]